MVREGRYAMLDADEALVAIMRDGWPDPRLFSEIVGSVLASALERARCCNQGVTACGEMVALLWERGQAEAALELEELWNTALRESCFHLHCAYPREILAIGGEIESIHAVHTHVLQ